MGHVKASIMLEIRGPPQLGLLHLLSFCVVATHRSHQQSRGGSNTSSFGNPKIQSTPIELMLSSSSLSNNALQYAHLGIWNLELLHQYTSMTTSKKTFFQKFGPAALGRGLWGNRPMPTKYKILFAGQAVIFTMAIWVRGQDVERAQAKKKLDEAEKQRAEIASNASAAAAAPSTDAAKNVDSSK